MSSPECNRHQTTCHLAPNLSLSQAASSSARRGCPCSGMPCAPSPRAYPGRSPAAHPRGPSVTRRCARGMPWAGRGGQRGRRRQRGCGGGGGGARGRPSIWCWWPRWKGAGEWEGREDICGGERVSGRGEMWRGKSRWERRDVEGRERRDVEERERRERRGEAVLLVAGLCRCSTACCYPAYPAPCF